MFETAKSHLENAEHMLHINFKIFRELRIMPKILEEMNKCVFFLFPWMYKKDFFEKDDLKNIWKIVKLNSIHKKSCLEFARKDKLVILLNDGYEVLNENVLEELLNSLKCAMVQIEEKI